jgi:hypothetical protein
MVPSIIAPSNFFCTTASSFLILASSFLAAFREFDVVFSFVVAASRSKPVARNFSDTSERVDFVLLRLSSSLAIFFATLSSDLDPHFRALLAMSWMLLALLFSATAVFRSCSILSFRQSIVTLKFFLFT